MWMCGCVSGMYRKVDCVIAGKRCANKCMRYMDVSFMILRQCFFFFGMSQCVIQLKRFHAPVPCTYECACVRLCMYVCDCM